VMVNRISRSGWCEAMLGQGSNVGLRVDHLSTRSISVAEPHPLCNGVLSSRTVIPELRFTIVHT
jgi:hypothetical protein